MMSYIILLSMALRGTKMNGAIRKHIQKSSKGDFVSSFQLVKIFSGELGEKFVDDVAANEYRKKAIEQLEPSKLRITNIKIVNFKGFSDLELSFSEKTTVLVGNNGCGKSSVLEGIKKSMTHLISRLSTNSTNGDLIEEHEIKNNCDFSTIVFNYSLNGVNFSMELSQGSSLSSVKRKGKYTEITDLTSLFKQANDLYSDFNFPLLASYTVDRANDVTTKDIDKSDEIRDSHIWNKAKAYEKSTTGKADFKIFFRWFKELIEDENSENSEAKSIRILIEQKERDLNSPLIKSIIKKSNKSEIENDAIEQYKNEIKELKNRLESLTSQNNLSLDITRSAIYSFLKGFSNLKLSRKPLDLTICKGDEQFSVLQLSQGEKSILALVADIARRLTLLNPSLSNPLDGTGIVLIDEIDLHLHPSWQQKIIKRLEETFKNIQFIVTTHSPQVCHTIDSENIWLIKEGAKFKAPKGVRGAVSSWVLENLFEVEERPPEDQYTQLLKEYKELVHEDDYDSKYALEVRRKLINHFGRDYDVLIELDLYIENKEWEKGLEESK